MPAGNSVCRGSRAAFIQAAWLSLLVAACRRDPITPKPAGPTVDANIYALGVCALKYYRLSECDLLASDATDDCTQTCIDESLDTLAADPCWAESMEVRRCTIREAGCEAIDDEELVEDAVCAHRQVVLDTCES